MGFAVARGVGRDAALAGISKSLASTDPERALSFAARIERNEPGSLGANARYWIGCDHVQTLLRRDLSEAAAWAGSISDERTQEGAIGGVVDAWIHQDVYAAKEWVEKLPPSSAKRRARTSIAYHLAMTDIEAAQEWAEGIPEGKTREEVMVTIARHMASPTVSYGSEGMTKDWPGGGPQFAAQWAQRLPEGKSKEIALVAIAKVWASDDAPGAVAWAEGLPEGKTQAKVFDAIVTSQIETVASPGNCGLKFEHAMSTVEDLPNSYHERCYKAVINAWFNHTKPQEIADWLIKFPSGPLKDNLVVHSAFGIVNRTPETALQLVDEMVDEERRNSFRVRMIKEWLYRDKNGATRWIREAALPPDVKEKLLKVEVDEVPASTR